MEDILKLNETRTNIVPESLLGYKLFSDFELLYSSRDNLDVIYQFSELPPHPLSIAIEAYMKVVNFDMEPKVNRYIIKRLMSMKSAEEVLWEIERYTKVSFNVDIDTDGKPKTRYSPNELKVTIEEIETDRPEIILDILQALFAALLYYKRYSLLIENLIIRLNATITRESQTNNQVSYNITELNFLNL